MAAKQVHFQGELASEAFSLYLSITRMHGEFLIGTHLINT
jgi:hypothetical protein